MYNNGEAIKEENHQPIKRKEGRMCDECMEG